jgi:hypothetical protein
MKRTKVNYRKIAEDYYGISVKGMHVHHIDGNCNNNSPDNLLICTKEEHAQHHFDMGQPEIASLLLGQTLDNWHSVIGKIGAVASKGIKKQYTMTEKALQQREKARSAKGDPKQTKLSLSGDDRTVNQKEGRIKTSLSKTKREKTSKELEQFTSFRNKGVTASTLAMTGSKKLVNPTTNDKKFAIPDTDKWNYLISNGYIILSISNKE